MSARDRTDTLALYSLGLLAEEEEQDVRHVLATDPEASHEVATFQALVAELDTAPPEPPPPGLLDRLRQTTRAQREPETLVGTVAELIDATTRRARHLLRLLHAEEPWLDMYPGCRLMHLRPGPRIARPGLDVGFVSLEPGTPFPEHEHLGKESVLVLTGTLIDLTSGDRYGPGDLVEMGAGTVHGVAAGPDERLVYLVVVGGVKIPGIEVPEPPAEFIW